MSRGRTFCRIAAAIAVGILAFPVSAFAATPGELQRFEALPEPAGSSVYYDIDAHGRILEIDHPARKARVLGRVPVEELSPGESRLWGRYVPEQKFAYLFAGKPYARGRENIHRLYTYDLTRQELKKHAVFIGMDYEDGRIVAISRDTLILEPAGEVVGRIYNPLVSAFSGMTTLSAHDIAHGKWTAFPAENRVLFCDALPRDVAIVNCDVDTGEHSQCLLSEVIPRRSEKTTLSVSHLNRLVALVVVWEQGSDSAVSAVVSLHRERPAVRVIASAELPKFVSKSRVAPLADGGFAVYRFGESPRGFARLTGEIQCFYVEEGIEGFRQTESITFEPRTELPLIAEDGHVVIASRCLFDYVSMSDIGLALYNKAFSPVTWEEREEIVRRTGNLSDDERLKMPWGPYDPVTVEHLEILDEQHVAR